MQVTSMKVGDLFPRPRLRLQADGVGVDLSEAVSVTARVRLPGSTSHVDRDVTVADQDVTANHGIVTVVLIDGDTDFQGTIKFDIEVEWATGVQTWPSRGYFKIWLLEDADSAQGGGPPLVGSSGDPFTLDRIYDVNISSVADNDLLQYDSTSARWLNVAPADVRSTLGLGSAALSSTTDFIRSSVTQAGAALTPTAQTLWSFQPADTNRGPFQWVMGGAAFDSVFDPVMYLGYNVADGGGVAKSGEASFRTALESHYRNGGVNNFEYYFEYMSGDLVTRRRPFFLQMDKSTGAVNSMQFSANTAYFTQESDEAPYFTISRGNITSAPYAGTPIEWRIKAASAQNAVFTMENSTSVALTVETLSANSAVLRAGSIANENLYLFDNRGIAVNVQDNAAALTVKGGAVGSVAVFRAGSVAGNLTTWQDNASSVLASVSAAGLATFAGVTLTDATNLVFGTSTGTKIGTATSQKLGFYNATPIIRPSGSILTALSNLGLVGSPTLASTALSDTASLAYLASANTFTAGQTVAGSTDTQQLIVKGAVGQTAGLQHWRNSADTTLAYISAVGYAQFAGISSTANALIDGSADNIQLRVQGHSVQNANLQTWESSAGSVLASVSAAGAIKGASIGPVSGNLNILDSTGSIVAQARTTDFTVVYRLIASATAGTEAFRTFGNSLFGVSAATHIPVQVRGFASQTANLQTWESSAGSVLASVNAAGHASFDGGLRIPTLQSFRFGPSGDSSERLFATETRYGYSTGYRAIMLGSSATASSGNLAATTVSFGYDPAINASGSFTGDGAEVIFRNGMTFMLPNATNDGWVRVQQLNATNLTTRVQSFIDGSADQVQLRVQGHSAQSDNLQTWENSGGTILARVGSSGFIASSGGFGNPAAGNPYILPAAGSLTALSQNAAHVPWTVKGAAAQTANLQTWEDSAGTVLAYVGTQGEWRTAGTFGSTASGKTYLQPNYDTGAFGIVTNNAANKGLVIRGMASQTGNFQEWQSSAGTVLASLSAAGAAVFTNSATVTHPSNGAGVYVTNGTTSSVRIEPGTGVGGLGINAPSGGWARNLASVWTNDFATRLGVFGFYGSSDTLTYTFVGQAYNSGTNTQWSGSTGAMTVNANAFIDGSADNIQLRVQGHSAQTSNLQTWENSAGTVLLSVDSGGALVGGSPVSVKLWNRTVQGTGGGSLYIGGSATGGATDGVVIDGNATTFSTGVTSGEWSSLRVGQNNNPNASSTAIHNTILVNPTINYASGGAGSYNALRIKVTETALPSGANYLIYASAGAAGTTEKFSITNAGLGTFAGGVSLADASDLTIGTTTGSKIGQASSKIGFFNATPVAKPTGVAVDAASIHAALVSLGLISA